MTVNIFYIDNDPIAAAESLPDNYCGSSHFGGKMIIESAQMLANAYGDLSDAPRTATGTIRKHSYLHHPCSKWVLESASNFNWLLDHALAMVVEKIKRGGPRHFTYDFINWCMDNPPKINEIGLTKPAQAMPQEYRSSDPVSSYRNYIKGEKLAQLPCVWTRNKPIWI
jgi:hypothetical protein